MPAKNERERWIDDVGRWLARRAKRTRPRPLRPGLYLTADVIAFLDRHPSAKGECLGTALTRPRTLSARLILLRVEGAPCDEQTEFDRID
jgi:hypothetical protein